MVDQRLSEYRKKRSGSGSGEPSGTGEPSGSSQSSGSGRSKGHDRPVFVIQRHDASTLHFDFRLEIDGVLVSWAVPKGPSVDPSQKRLAHRTEDHPLDYADFEGRIDQGYGAGTVIVWDTGTYENLTTRKNSPVPAGQALDDGHLKVELHGDKLSGAFALTRTRSGQDASDWLLVKVKDSGADRRRNPTSTQNESVLSGRTNDDLEPD